MLLFRPRHLLSSFHVTRDFESENTEMCSNAPSPRIFSFGIFAVRNGEVLVIHQKSGNHWTLSKGRPERGETPRQTAIRELKEETGLDIDRFLSDRTFFTDYEVVKRDGRRMRKRVTYFVAEVKPGEVKVQESELHGYRWVKMAATPIETVERMKLTHEEDKQVALQMLSYVAQCRAERMQQRL